MSSRLDDVDLSLQIGDKKEYNKTLKKWQIRLLGLQQALRTSGHALLIAFEGWDASGKGGAIKRLTAPLDPRGFRVYSIGPPTDEEKRHHYLWRFWTHIPAVGEIVIFDRSWYGRVLVERVEGFCCDTEWQRAYEEINSFERQLADSGVLVLKFWLHISDEEQLRRFREREQDPLKSWKIGSEDWRNRAKRPAYLTAAEDMLRKTDTKHCPWRLVSAEHKWNGRIEVIKTVVEELESILGKHKAEPVASAQDPVTGST
ncbi:UDP-galactose-lipid carrier transferase [bacterium]|nr:UDP-galactose-lipid carrier transferase [bacterium]